jgi:hypothetical protein
MFPPDYWSRLNHAITQFDMHLRRRLNKRPQPPRPTHVANPVHVHAARILKISDVTRRDPGCGQSSPDLVLLLDDGREFSAGAGMTARHIPQLGDYLVTQEDGYTYLNPAAVFDRKYSPIAQATA